MPGTAPTTPRRTAGRPARWLAPALLLPVLVACGGGGGSDSGAGGQSSAAGTAELGGTPPAEGQQPEDQRTKAGGNQGGFAGAGNVSASVTGTWPDRIFLSLTSTVTSTFTATVKDVHDCAGGSKSSASTSVPFSGGKASTQVSLSGPRPATETIKICFTVTAGGKSQPVKADGKVDVPESTGTSGGGGNGGQNGGATSGTTSGSSASSRSTP
ncbi:hypothetical protein [Kitasatospora sp. A2-31]|uniref:hypothetical protein n=1 Tax=Kitasatospora sp. A2-31 TaxID=2916414 RepID=UPI001EE9F342|nr:hypothetical protein [Kitasatospora sp. A2-31]MCG6495512.1 hypothetical protein [Kitasatospora sp. A2-31]